MKTATVSEARDDFRRLAEDRLAAFELPWCEVQPAMPIRQLAIQLLWTHELRAADALQLAAAFAFARAASEPTEFV